MITVSITGTIFNEVIVHESWRITVIKRERCFGCCAVITAMVAVTTEIILRDGSDGDNISGGSDGDHNSIHCGDGDGDEGERKHDDGSPVDEAADELHLRISERQHHLHEALFPSIKLDASDRLQRKSVFDGDNVMTVTVWNYTIILMVMVMMMVMVMVWKWLWRWCWYLNDLIGHLHSVIGEFQGFLPG